ncbi:MAG: hypothetical protein L0228_08040 [Planctomycetes bacterium]|nr:hypothetical protein [Planctomycetota bacterium]
MRLLTFIAATLLACAATASVCAADLAEIDRTIAKEPAYTSKPKYCLLVFGPQAKGRVWLVQDGDVLYVDGNGNGDLTELDERTKGHRPDEKTTAFGVAELSLPDDKSQYKHFRLQMYRYVAEGRVISSIDMTITIDGKGWSARCQAFADRPKDAPIIHFNGPLTYLSPHPRTFVPGKAAYLTIYTGTAGLGVNTYAWRSANQIVFGADGPLLAKIVYPNKNPDGEPLRATVTLSFDDCCGGGTITGQVPVPDDVGPGQARVTILTQRPVPNLRPTTFLIPVVSNGER